MILAAALVVAGGCRRDPAAEEAANLVRDRSALSNIIAADMKAEVALKAVGDAERQQKDEEAALLLERNVLPATDAALTLAASTAITTAWGRTRKDELVAVLTERKTEIPKYAAALRAHDWDLELASVERQIAIEYRAMKVAEAIQGLSSGSPDAR